MATAPVDEILGQLADLGFLVWRLDQSHVGMWHVVLEDTQAQPLQHYAADGPTPGAVLLEALRKAGIVITDE